MKFVDCQRIGIIVLAILAIGAICQARAEENSPLAFITEYIRELSENENARAKAEHLPIDKLIPNIIKLYEQKIALIQKMSDISSAYLVGPKPDVDYDKLATDMPTG